jgi:hypothetical protein
MSIADIHKEVAKEEKMIKIRGPRISSSQNLRRTSSLAAVAATVDEDGFAPVPRRSKLQLQMASNTNTHEDGGGTSKNNNKQQVAHPSLRRSQSQPTVSSKAGGEAPPPPTTETSNVVSPEECSKKMKNILKEYFIGGDTDDAVLSVDELIQVGKDGSIERGAKAIEGASLLVMESKEVEVKKMLTVMTKVVSDGKLEKESIVKGLYDPLQFLSDLEIDAPLARNHLAMIVVECLKLGALPSLEFLKEAPEYFHTDGKPAAFTVKVLKMRGGDPSEDELAVVRALMTEDDKKAFDSGKAMFEA